MNSYFTPNSRSTFLSLREHEQSNQSSIHQEQQSSYVLIRGLYSVINYDHLIGDNFLQKLFNFKKLSIFGTKSKI